LFLQWQLYRKWTERLFKEQFIAWKSGHGDKDPSEGWYESELKFVDNYVIPLATKLQECGVFGAAGAMYLEYARANRKEIEEKGERLVHEMLERCQAEFMAELMQKRDGVPLPSALSFRISEGSSVAGCEDTAPPDLSFRISDQLGPGPGGVRATCSKVITARHCLISPQSTSSRRVLSCSLKLNSQLFMSKEWSMRDLLSASKPPQTKSALPSPYSNVA